MIKLQTIPLSITKYLIIFRVGILKKIESVQRWQPLKFELTHQKTHSIELKLHTKDLLASISVSWLLSFNYFAYYGISNFNPDITFLYCSRVHLKQFFLKKQIICLTYHTLALRTDTFVDSLSIRCCSELG